MAFALNSANVTGARVTLSVYEQGGSHHARVTVMGPDPETQPNPEAQTEDAPGGPIPTPASPAVLLMIGGNQEKDDATLEFEQALQAALQNLLDAKGI